jgi:threonine/homoserine/homoserine lactone efflux protein
LAASAELLIVLKWVGGAYLVFLGIQVWRSPAIGSLPGSSAAVVTRTKVFRQGFLAAVSNPKGILFFVAFLPQFLVTDSPLLIQFAIMTLTFVGIEIITETVIALGSEKVQPFLAKFGKRVNQTFGGVFVVIGIALPLRG